MTVYNSLREANIARQAEWCPDEHPDLSFRGCELAGEIGELCEHLITNKVGPTWPLQVREELGDGFICLDLIGICAGVAPLGEAHPSGFSSQYPMYNEVAGHLGWRVGALCNTIKKLERERQGWRGSRATIADLEQHMYFVSGALDWIVRRMAFNRSQVIADKFNATTEKVGLQTRLVLV